MATVSTTLDHGGRGAFRIYDGTTQLGEMVVGVKGNQLTVYHTKVAPEAEGNGYAKQLLNAVVNYARAHQLRVRPLCPYVHAEFQRNPDQYADLWTVPAG